MHSAAAMGLSPLSAAGAADEVTAESAGLSERVVSTLPYCDGEELSMIARSLALPAAVANTTPELAARLVLVCSALPEAQRAEAAIWTLRAAGGGAIASAAALNVLEACVATADLRRQPPMVFMAAAEGLSWRTGIDRHFAVSDDAAAQGTSTAPAPVATLIRRLHRIKSADDAARACVALRWCGASKLPGRAGSEEHPQLPTGATVALFGGATGGPALVDSLAERVANFATASAFQQQLTMELLGAVVTKADQISDTATCEKLQSLTCEALGMACTAAATSDGASRDALRGIARLTASFVHRWPTDAAELLSEVAAPLDGVPTHRFPVLPRHDYEHAGSGLVQSSASFDTITGYRGYMRLFATSTAATVGQRAALASEIPSVDVAADESARWLAAVAHNSRLNGGRSDAADVPGAWAVLSALSKAKMLDPSLVKVVATATTADHLQGAAEVADAIRAVDPPSRWLSDSVRAALVGASTVPDVATDADGSLRTGEVLTTSAACVALQSLLTVGALERSEAGTIAASASKDRASWSAVDSASAALTLALLRSNVSVAGEILRTCTLIDHLASLSADATEAPAVAVARALSACMLLPQSMAVKGGTSLRSAVTADALNLLQQHPRFVQRFVDEALVGTVTVPVVAACCAAVGRLQERMSPFNVLRVWRRCQEHASARGPSGEAPSIGDGLQSEAALATSGAASSLPELADLTDRCRTLIAQLLPVAHAGTLEELSVIATSMAALPSAPPAAQIDALEAAVTRRCVEAGEAGDLDVAIAVDLLVALRRLYVPRGEAADLLERAVSPVLSDPRDVGKVLSILSASSDAGLVEVAVRETRRILVASPSPAALEVLASGALEAERPPLAAREVFAELGARGIERTAAMVDAGEVVLPSAAAQCIACASRYSGKASSAAADKEAILSVLEWISGDAAPLLSPTALVGVISFMASAGVNDADYAHSLGAHLSILAPQMTPRELADGIFHLSVCGGFNSVHLQRVADVVVDRSDEFRCTIDAVRLLHGFTKMGVMHRGAYNTLATRMRKRPMLHGVGVRDAVVALDALSGARYLDEAVFSALTRRIQRAVRQCGPIDVALAAQGHADVYVVNSDFYNALADRALELAGPIEPTDPEVEGADEAAVPPAVEATANNKRAEVFPLGAGVRLLESLGAAGIERHDAAEAVIVRIADDHADDMSHTDALRLLGALCDMNYHGEAIEGLSELLVERIGAFSSVDLKELCCMLLMMNWRDDALLRAIGDHAVRLESEDALEPLAARLTLDTLGHFLHFHPMARAELSDPARSVSKHVIDDDGAGANPGLTAGGSKLSAITA
jgi:hypothetical protein